MEKLALGADIGGSHITCQLINLTSRYPVDNTKCRVQVNSRASKNEILEKWISALKGAAGQYPFHSMTGIGFAMPGPFDYHGGTAWFKGVDKFDTLYGINIREEIQIRLNLPLHYPIRFFNDASCFAIGESWMGDASKYERVIAVTIGTGFGTTFIKNGIPQAGTEGIPEDGFLYHIPFGHSIADDYFSTRWFLKIYTQKTGRKIMNVKDIYDEAYNDPLVVEVFSEFGTNLGRFLGPWLKKFNAECLVLGGNISKSYLLFKNEMEEQFRKHSVNPVVYLSRMEENAALIGSARLCDDSYYSRIIKPDNE